jgi:ABC-type dipeptide/oligopeptide/nickel transport system permease component
MRGADYVIKRSIFALVTVWVAVTLNFILFRLLPGSSVSGLRCQACTPQFKEALIKEYGLDKSKWQQYVTYLGNLLHGDLGYSQYNNIPVWDAIKEPILNTLPMVLTGTLISVVLGVFCGILAAWRRGTLTADKLNTWTALAFYAAPTQWLGILVIFYLAANLGLPVAGIKSPDLGILTPASTWQVLDDRIRHLILPALTLGIGLYGEYAIVVRSSMLETLGEDYVLTARAKGLANWEIIWKHGLRNAMLPLVTLLALSVGYIVAGAIVVEDVFSYPGIGLATIDAIDHRDYAVLQGIFLVLTIAVIFSNFVADLLYFKLDPRVTT